MYTKVVLEIYTEADTGSLLEGIEDLGPHTARHVHVVSEEPFAKDEREFGKMLAAATYMARSDGLHPG